MHATQDIVSIWSKFDNFPMETLTKAWYFQRGGETKQREVSLMREHRLQYGIAGNCFDLSLWLLHEFSEAGLKAYPVFTPDAHVAVIAVNDSGHRYFCDLGDQWLAPVLVDSTHPDFTTERMTGFFPAAEIQVSVEGEDLTFAYHRPNGKSSHQTFSLRPVPHQEFMQAAEICQRNRNLKPLLECRVPFAGQRAHWEFYDWESAESTDKGIKREPRNLDVAYWCSKIHEKTGYDPDFLEEALQIYASRRTSSEK
ncbi:hypothetical protein [Paenibacillus gansuensis]|uniref:Acetyltransferase n=1 Tax=Paenibacillus gansuensis TaxID=306542 RepID=A0ABW5P9I7_9BACL